MFYKTFYRDIAIVAVLLAVLAGGSWAVYKLVFSRIDLPSVSADMDNSTEEQLGDLIIDQMIDKQPGYYRVNSDEVEDAITKIKRVLVKGIGKPSYKYKFYVVNNPDVNAFTLPGGNIVIFSGLLEMADSAEQVAAVIAHELGHAEQKHVINRLAASIGIGVILSVITGTDPTIIHQIIEKLISTKFDRAQEEEADLYGLKLLEKCNISPKQMANFFKKMNDKGLNYDKRLEVLMTHPNNDARIKLSESYKTKRNFTEQKIKIDWQELVVALKGAKVE